MHDKKFNPENLERLDRPERHESTDFNNLLIQLEIDTGQVIADIGAGVGFYSIPFAKKAEKVYAVDISQDMLDYLNNKLEKGQIENVKTILSTEEKIDISDDSVDLM
jgi:ubiquinone/menaquinone biosynthesis C-methylase UbiE